jgi:predicted kinase
MAFLPSGVGVMPFDLEQAVGRAEVELVPVDIETTACPVLILMSGLPGSGKSYLSEQICAQLPCVIIESDRVRKVLFAPPTYSAEESAIVHRTCQQLMRRLLKRGVRVIFDATNLIEFHRELLYALAQCCGAQLLIVRTYAPEAVIRARLEQRQARGNNASDADWQVYRRMSESEQEIRRPHWCIDTSQDTRNAVRTIVKAACRPSKQQKRETARAQAISSTNA